MIYDYQKMIELIHFRGKLNWNQIAIIRKFI